MNEAKEEEKTNEPNNDRRNSRSRSRSRHQSTKPNQIQITEVGTNVALSVETVKSENKEETNAVISQVYSKIKGHGEDTLRYLRFFDSSKWPTSDRVKLGVSFENIEWDSVILKMVLAKLNAGKADKKFRTIAVLDWNCPGFISTAAFHCKLKVPVYGVDMTAKQMLTISNDDNKEGTFELKSYKEREEVPNKVNVVHFNCDKEDNDYLPVIEKHIGGKEDDSPGVAIFNTNHASNQFLTFPDRFGIHIILRLFYDGKGKDGKPVNVWFVFFRFDMDKKKITDLLNRAVQNIWLYSNTRQRQSGRKNFSPSLLMATVKEPNDQSPKLHRFDTTTMKFLTLDEYDDKVRQKTQQQPQQPGPQQQQQSPTLQRQRPSWIKFRSRSRGRGRGRGGGRGRGRGRGGRDQNMNRNDNKNNNGNTNNSNSNNLINTEQKAPPKTTSQAPTETTTTQVNRVSGILDNMQSTDLELMAKLKRLDELEKKRQQASVTMPTISTNRPFVVPS